MSIEIIIFNFNEILRRKSPKIIIHSEPRNMRERERKEDPTFIQNIRRWPSFVVNVTDSLHFL